MTNLFYKIYSKIFQYEIHTIMQNSCSMYFQYSTSQQLLTRIWAHLYFFSFYFVLLFFELYFNKLCNLICVFNNHSLGILLHNIYHHIYLFSYNINHPLLSIQNNQSNTNFYINDFFVYFYKPYYKKLYHKHKKVFSVFRLIVICN